MVHYVLAGRKCKNYIFFSDAGRNKYSELTENYVNHYEF